MKIILSSICHGAYTDLLPVSAGHMLGQPVVDTEALVTQRTQPLAAGVKTRVGRGRGLHRHWSLALQSIITVQGYTQHSVREAPISIDNINPRNQ